MATIDDVVKASGVSRSTVFRFLNGSNVRADARKSILKAMEELNYESSAVYKQQNITIEISACKDFEGFKGFVDVVQGITERAGEKGIKVQISRRFGESIEDYYSKGSSADGLKGIVIMGKGIEEEEREAEFLLSRKIPHIFVNRIMEHPDISYVSVNVKAVACEMVEQLLAQGHRDILVTGNLNGHRVDRDKLEGYKMAYQKYGIKVPQKYYLASATGGEWEKAVTEIFQEGHLPTAYFGISDSLAMNFINIAQSFGYKVPEDIVVTGMDDIDAAKYFKPSITTVRFPFQKMGVLAVDHLLQLITDETVSCLKTTVKHELIFRESCKKIN